MTIEQQDLAWACLPKEKREEARILYKTQRYDARYALICLYGKHNLTSDTEPEEMLMVSKKQVMTELCRAANLQNDREEDWIRAGEEIEFTLTQLFGDKCLPDKEQPKPKFKYNIGDLVTYKGKVKKVIRQESDWNGNNTYICSTSNGQSPLCFNEIDLEPYTEEYRNLSQETANCDKSEDNQLKNNMEDKELNLYELLKVGDTIYSPVFGERIVRAIMSDRLCDSTFICYKNGKIWEYGEPIVFPSKELYEKYPLDAYSAWMEWASERKPKRWRAKSSAGVAVSECEGHWEDYSYWYITSDGVIAQEEEMNCKVDTLRYELGNYFRTEEGAKQAFEAVRDMLEKFHENHTEK